MSNRTRTLRKALDHATDALEMTAYAEGYQAASNALDELSNIKYNFDEHIFAEHLRWAAKELRGENDNA